MIRRILPVVISGGAGTRLWPLSTEIKPKQFHNLAAEGSMIQETVGRLVHASGIEVLTPIVVCNERHHDVVENQFRQLGLAPPTLILEPFGRNTAPVAMAAALVAEATAPDALILLMPSDHVIAQPDRFCEVIAEAASMADEWIVTFGVTPTAPETGYGYIEAGAIIDGRVRQIAKFVEKPELKTAQAYLADSRFLWNGGIFLFSPDVMLAEMQRLAPEVAQSVAAAVPDECRSGRLIRLDPARLAECPSISLDYAVMEHTGRAAVIPLDAGWADVGSWEALWQLGERDAQDNLLHGPVEAIDSTGCLVWSDGVAIGVLGLRDMVVVQAEGGVLVMPRDRSQHVKILVDQMKRVNAESRDKQ